MSDASTIPLFIDGEHRQAKTGATYDVVHPATGKVFSHAAAATAEDVYVVLSWSVSLAYSSTNAVKKP